MRIPNEDDQLELQLGMSWLSTTMDGETASSIDEHAAAAAASRGGTTDTTGRHRFLAELKRVEQESKFLEVFVYFIISIYCLLFGFRIEGVYVFSCIMIVIWRINCNEGFEF